MCGGAYRDSIPPCTLPRNPSPSHTLDAYLTARARLTWPGAQVWIRDGHHVLTRPDHEDVRLGTGGIRQARLAMYLLREEVHSG